MSDPIEATTDNGEAVLFRWNADKKVVEWAMPAREFPVWRSTDQWELSECSITELRAIAALKEAHNG